MTAWDSEGVTLSRPRRSSDELRGEREVSCKQRSQKGPRRLVLHDARNAAELLASQTGPKFTNSTAEHGGTAQRAVERAFVLCVG
jgi:hypothetical protein